jgi:hypothetical protein
MIIKPIKTIEPDTHSPEGMLMSAAEALYGAPSDLTPEANQIASALIENVLSAAGTARFAQVDILATLLDSCQITERTREISYRACRSINVVALSKIFSDLGLLDVMGPTSDD